MRRRILALTLAGAAAGGFVAAADLSRAIARASIATGRPDVRSAFFLLAVMLPLGALAALAVAPVAGIARRHLDLRLGLPLVVSALITAWATGAFATFATRFHAPGLTAALVTSVAVGTCVLSWPLSGAIDGWLARLARRTWVKLVLTAAGVALLLAGLIFLDTAAAASRRAASWTWLAILAAAGLAAGRAIFARLDDGRWPMRRAAVLPILGVAVVVCAVGLVQDGRRQRATLERGSFLLPAVDRVLAPVFDRDGDGFLSVLGGDDCDDAAAARSPWGVDIPGDGVDQDCRFGDVPARARAAVERRAPVDRVVLVTVGGLDSVRSPHLPALEAQPALRLTHGVGMAGKLPLIQTVVLTGRLDVYAGGPWLPAVVEDLGGAAFYAARDAKTRPPTFRPASGIQALDAAGLTTALIQRLETAPRHSFAWMNLEFSNAKPDEVDRAIATLLGELARMGSYRLLLVGLPRGVARSSLGKTAPVRGGPIAIFGDDVAAGEDGRVAGLLDVYPTILSWLGAPEPTDDWPELAPAPGFALDGERPGVAITGWLGAPNVLAATDGEGVVVQDDAHRRFLALRGGRSRELDESARPGDWAGPLLAALRDELLAAELRARNVSLSTVAPGLPADAVAMQGATLGHSLELLGYTRRERPEKQIEVMLYFTGGELLDRDDRLIYRVNKRIIVLRPGIDIRPFGTPRPGAIWACRLVIDPRGLEGKQLIVSLAVKRRNKFLHVTHGHSGWIFAANLR